MSALWYAMRAKPCKEDLLWGQLRAREIECFYPRIRVRTVNPRARKLRPYFPGYLFVNVDWEQDGFSALRWVPGAIGWVEFGGQPAWVPDALVHAIQRKVAAINEAGAKKRNGLQPGEQVVVLEGPFAGYEAIFDDHASGEERVRVLLTLISKRQLLLELPLSQIERKRQS